jgi:soluble lytic murein transglycosylase-like protein
MNLIRPGWPAVFLLLVHLVFVPQAVRAAVFEMAPTGVWQDVSRPAQVEPPVPKQPSSMSFPPTADPRLEAIAARFAISPALLEAVAWTESRHRANAVSRAGAMGVMQLMPATARSLGVRDPFDREQNMAGGAAYLRAQLDRFDNDLELALAAYNAGPGAVVRHGKVPPYVETRKYIQSVMDRLASAVFVPHSP